MTDPLPTHHKRKKEKKEKEKRGSAFSPRI
jgi:hypothetical protein